nr:alpha-1,2-mannosyltransferase mnn22 [Quercus suber]
MAAILGALVRKPKLLIAAGIICILLLAGHFFDAPQKTQKWASDLPFEVVWKDGGRTGKMPSGTAGKERPTGYNHPITPENAHTIQDPEDFRAHFDHIMSVPALTVQEAKEGCTWGEEDRVNYMFGNDIEWNNEDKSEEEISQRREEWHDFVKHDMIPWDKVKHYYTGRGIVIVGGNHDSWNRIKVTLRQLVMLKSELPVEIHYWGDEVNAEREKELTDIYEQTYFNDLSLTHNIFQIHHAAFKLPNYQFKTAALLNSPFREVILLDADNIPVMLPESLFHSEVYKEFGSVFWPDIARTRPANPAWAITNTACRMDEYEQESGQLMVDKRRFFYHLQLSLWMIADQGHYYAQFILGDKDCFRFAWHALKTRYGRPSRWVTSVGTNNGGKYCGHTFGQAHPDPHGDLAFLHGGLLKGVDFNVLRWNRAQPNGYFNAYKRSPTDERNTTLENVNIGYEHGKDAEYLPQDVRSKVKHGEWCTDMHDVDARPLEEILPGFSKRFEDIGGYWQLEPGYIPPVDSED